MSDYTLIWFPDAVNELRSLSVRAATAVLNNVTLLVADPYPPLASVTSEEDGLYALRIDRVTVHYDVVGQTVRILMIVPGGIGRSS